MEQVKWDELTSKQKHDELTARFYAVKEQRDRFLEFCKTVLPASNGFALWDHEVGCMFNELRKKDRKRLEDLLDECASYCPVDIQDKVRDALRLKPFERPSRLLEALKAIKDPEHCLTAHTVQGLRDIATAALDEIDPKNDYSSCTGPGDEGPEQLEGWDCRAGFAPKE